MAKRTEQTEMDLLLRRLARQGGASSHSSGGGDGQGSAGAHMDADELAAYAENALPDAARSRYTSHLSDCDSCRRLVAELSQAADAAGRIERGSAAVQGMIKPPSLWGRLSSVFSLPAVRFGVPALAVLSIAFVIFLSVRNRNQETLTARNNERPPNTSAAAPADEKRGALNANNANSNAAADGAAAQPQQPVANRQETPSPVKGQNAQEPSGELLARDDRTQSTGAGIQPTAPGAATTGAAVNGNRGTTEDQPKERRLPNLEDDAAKNKPAPQTAAAAPQPAQQPRESNEKSAAPAAPAKDKRQAETEQKSSVAVGGAANNDAVSSRQEGRAAPGAAASKAPQSESGASAARRRSARKTEELKEDAGKAGGGSYSGSAETRKAGGRTFRRQGNAWVDTAYNSSRATTNVTRGSEQYRALVADEPGLGSIAEQLGGEVVVVWKGRAYRIH